MVACVHSEVRKRGVAWHGTMDNREKEGVASCGLDSEMYRALIGHIGRDGLG